jgi:PucR-like helix-turn-helix protein/diguanylate cyclase with GGDEF domain
MAALSDMGRPFADRLRERRLELEEELFNRVRAIQDPTSPAEESYVRELRPTICAGLDYGLATIERGTAGRPPQIPDQLLLQARLAARNGISLQAVLRRYCSGNTLMTDILIAEAEDCSLPRTELKGFFRSLAMGFERLLSAVTEEYEREATQHTGTSEERRAELIDRLLAGELIEGSELSYDFTSWHLGLVAFGPDAADAVHAISEQADANLLMLRRREGVVWAWLGARRRDAVSKRPKSLPRTYRQASVGVGEPAQSLAGWRLTHRQAAAALPLAIRGRDPITSYADAPLLATALQEDLLSTSLGQLYLAPLAAERDGGATAKDTLRAYFAAEGNASSAAAALGVNRRTIAARLAAIEERLGCRLDAFSAEIQTALRLDTLGQQTR